MKRLVAFAAAVVLLAAPALAALIEYQDAGGKTWGASVMGYLNGSNQAQAVASATPLPVVSKTPAIVGYGVLNVTASSALASGLTPGINSGAWPATLGQVYVTNDPASGGTAYVCPFGGTCTSSNSIPVLVGQSYGFASPATTMTFIAATTATVRVQF